MQEILALNVGTLSGASVGFDSQPGTAVFDTSVSGSFFSPSVCCLARTLNTQSPNAFCSKLQSDLSALTGLPETPLIAASITYNTN